jgi:glucose-1-phosphate cytidylyltransferase
MADFIGNETFMLTYGDGVSSINIQKLLEFHHTHGKLGTITGVQPLARFGQMQFDGDRVLKFKEKPSGGEGWVNGGFFVLEPGIVDYIQSDQCVWEREPLERLAEEGQLVAFLHQGFWHSMDTFRDVNALNKMWQEGQAPWKIW